MCSSLAAGINVGERRLESRGPMGVSVTDDGSIGYGLLIYLVGECEQSRRGSKELGLIR
jgi:hypothetical protein